jgi:hypothetical protein
MRGPFLAACLLAAAALPAAVALDLVPHAHAAVSVAYTLEELIDASPTAVVAKATERNSVWEKVGDSKRIVTYTHLVIESRLYGELDDDVWVRTLGGVVGKIGQSVAGEAELRLGERAVLFLVRTKSDTLVVSGAAQGHFPIVEPKKEGEAPRLAMSPSPGEVLNRPGPRITVQEALVGQTVDAAVAKVKTTKAERDAAKKKREQQ